MNWEKFEDSAFEIRGSRGKWFYFFSSLTKGVHIGTLQTKYEKACCWVRGEVLDSPRRVKDVESKEAREALMRAEQRRCFWKRSKRNKKKRADTARWVDFRERTRATAGAWKGCERNEQGRTHASNRGQCKARSFFSRHPVRSSPPQSANRVIPNQTPPCCDTSV